MGPRTGVKRLGALALAATLLLTSAGLALATDDPEYPLQYGPQQIHAPEAWTKARGNGITIAIVDTGVQLDHPDLRDKLVQGYDFLEDDDTPQDAVGHGTHVAGIAGASTDNGVGIAGVAPDAKIMPIRVLGGEGTSPLSLLSLQRGVQYAYQQGAKVINLSLGEVTELGPEAIRTLEQSCLDAFNNGALCVAAAGNDGRGKPSRYAEDFRALLVAANDRNRNIADFSQKADTQWGVTAPGVAIDSTWLDSGYSFKQGTSMAAPHVAGVAALLFSQGLSIQQVVDKILSTATPMNDGGGTSGAGLVNAAAAVGADFTPDESPPAAPATTAATTPLSPGAEPQTASPTTVAVGPAPTVVLDEGTVEEGDFVRGGGSDFETAVGEGVKADPISSTDGFTASFALGVAAFVVVLALIGVGLRRVVLRRGIGAMSTGGRR